MDIIKALKSEICIRVAYGDKWLVYNCQKKEWEVYGQQYMQRKTRTIIKTKSQKIAVEKLLERW